jgi:hypothetical protein
LRELEPADRSERLQRSVERLLRRSGPGRRLCPDLPGLRAFARALDVEPGLLAGRLRAADRSRGPLFVDLEPRVAEIARRHPDCSDALLAQAEVVCHGRFDLLGSGERSAVREDGGLDWHADWTCGARWPEDVHHTRQRIVRSDGSDVKIPWELSRAQHLLILGQAYRLASHRLPAADARAARARYAATARAHLLDWIRSNPRGLGINWACTMEVAIRATCWIQAWALLRDSDEFDGSFLLTLSRALWMHGRHIRRNLETTPGRPPTNHYVADLVGLLAVAAFLRELKESREWTHRAWHGIVEQLDAQVLEDGASYERSLSYHRLVTEMFLHAALVRTGAGHALPDRYATTLARMLEFTAACTRPDGSVPQWGDADDGRLLPLEPRAAGDARDQRHLLGLGGALLDRPDLLAAAGERDWEALWLLGPAVRGSACASGAASRGFPRVGYYVLRHEDVHVAVSWGAVGTAGLGNHTHNDLGALCLWARGLEWIADPGTGTYTRDPGLRNRLRSVAAHATLQLGDREPNPFGGGVDDLFRVSEHARPSVQTFVTDGQTALLRGSHRGFSAGHEEWIHERSVRLDGPRRTLWILDSLVCREARAGPAGAETMRLRFPLGPEVEEPLWRRDGDWPAGLRDAFDGRPVGRGLLLRSKDGASLWLAFDLPPESRVEVVSAPYSPSYGVVREGRVVTATIPRADSVRLASVICIP